MTTVGVGLLCYNMWICIEILTFWRNILSLKMKTVCSYETLLSTYKPMQCQPWIWRQYISPKHFYVPTSPHGITAQKTKTDIFSPLEPKIQLDNWINCWLSASSRTKQWLWNSKIMVQKHPCLISHDVHLNRRKVQHHRNQVNYYNYSAESEVNCELKLNLKFANNLIPVYSISEELWTYTTQSNLSTTLLHMNPFLYKMTKPMAVSNSCSCIPLLQPMYY